MSLRLAARSALAGVLVGCGGNGSSAEVPEDPPPVAFESDAICIVTGADTLHLTVELAENEAQRTHGLMERQRLGPDSGMLFLHAEPQPPESGYWMFRTLIPLDIAYLGPDGEIASIRHMQPCTSPARRWCTGYPAGVSYSSALEVNQGYFAANGVGVGSRVVRAGEPGCGRAARADRHP